MYKVCLSTSLSNRGHKIRTSSQIITYFNILFSGHTEQGSDTVPIRRPVREPPEAPRGVWLDVRHGSKNDRNKILQVVIFSSNSKRATTAAKLLLAGQQEKGYDGSCALRSL